MVPNSDHRVWTAAGSEAPRRFRKQGHARRRPHPRDSAGRADHGQSPSACNRQVGSRFSGLVRPLSASSAAARHTVGIEPNRRLKHRLSRPRWLKPHCRATSPILSSGLRKREVARSRRISILSEEVAGEVQVRRPRGKTTTGQVPEGAKEIRVTADGNVEKVQ